MSNILEPEEIDALMADLSQQRNSEERDQPPGDTSESGERYDFASQDYAVHRLIPALSLIQTQFAEALKNRIRTFVHGIEVVRPERIAVMKFGEIKRSLPPPCDITVINAPPLGAPLYLVFEPDLVFSLVDQFFGGSGRPAKPRQGADFAPTEWRFMERLSQALMPDISASWQSALSIRPELVERHSDFRFVDDIADGDTLMATRFSVQVGAIEASLWLMVPWAAIDPIRDSLGGVLRATRSEYDAQWKARLQAGLEGSPLDLVAVLARSSINLNRVARLRVGDILPIDSPGVVSLNIEGMPLLTGSFGTHQGQMAVKVDASLPNPRKI